MRWILLLVTVLMAACGPTGPQTLYVQPAPDGEWDDPAGMALVASFTTIQDAVDTAAAGDTVEVPSGTYPELVSMRPGVSVVGAGQGQTIVEGRFSVNDDDNSSIASLSVDCTSSTGINIDSSEYVTINDVEVSGCGSNGLWLENVTMHVTMDDLYVHNNGNFGLKLIWTEDITLTNSLVTSNGLAGWWSQFTNSGLVAHNTFVGNGFGGPPDEPLAAVSLWEAAGEDVANNIMVGNARGIEQEYGGGTVTSNLVWGNTVDYALDAAASATDLSLDPGFVAGPEGDYHLVATSPAIDAGDPAWSAAVDCDGEERPQGSGPDLGFDEYSESGFELVLTEVMANAADEGTGEFVELLNTGGSGVELAGLVLTDGDQQDVLVAWDGPTLLAPGGRAVILDSQYAGQYSIDPAAVLLTTDDSHLGNGLTTADPISLLEADASTTIATFSFPRDPGDGVSLEAVDEDAGDVAGNWQASLCAAASSPGSEACFPEAGDPASLVITEVMANPLDEGTGEFVELFNGGSDPVPGSGLVLRDGGGNEDVLQGFAGGAALIPAGAHAMVVDPDFAWEYPLPPGIVLLTAPDSTLGNGLSTTDTVTLLQPDGATVIDALSFPTNPGDGVSVQKIDYAAGDLASNWEPGDASCATGHSAGRLNVAAGATCGPVVINEVMANPLNEATGEYVELFNAGDDDVDLTGLMLSDGDVVEALVALDGGPTLLAAGELAVVVDAQTDGLGIPAGVVLVTTPDNTLGNALSTSDPIQLLESDGVTVIDAWQAPFNPGNGVSVERVTVLEAANDAANWEASPCAGGGSPGLPNCATTGEAGGDLSAIELLVTEVMANPLTEATGEYVELFNDGTGPVDLAGFVLWDGDAADPLEGFVDPADTVLEPGGWAVILDAGYAGEYTIPADALLLTTDDQALASGLAISDPIVLLEPDGTTVVDGFSFPQNGGDGVSIERLDLADGDVESNWAPASCGPTPGAANCP